MINLAANFRKVRLEKGLTQKEVARRAGISERLYQVYEYGKSLPSAKILFSLADALDVSLDYLAERTTNPNLHKS